MPVLDRLSCLSTGTDVGWARCITHSCSKNTENSPDPKQWSQASTHRSPGRELGAVCVASCFFLLVADTTREEGEKSRPKLFVKMPEGPPRVGRNIHAPECLEPRLFEYARDRCFGRRCKRVRRWSLQPRMDDYWTPNRNLIATFGTLDDFNP